MTPNYNGNGDGETLIVRQLAVMTRDWPGKDDPGVENRDLMQQLAV